MTTNDEIRASLDFSILGLNSKLEVFSHVANMLKVFDEPRFPLCIGYSDSTYKWKWVNQTFANLLGYEKEYIYTHPWTDFIEEGESERVLAMYKEKEKNGEKFEQYTITHKKADGTNILLSWYTSDIDKNGLIFCTASIPSKY